MNSLEALQCIPRFDHVTSILISKHFSLEKLGAISEIDTRQWARTL